MTRAGLACALALLLHGCAQAGPGTFTLSLVGTNDIHGTLLGPDGDNGLPVLGAYLANLRAARTKDGGAVLLLDAGDMLQGSLESNLNEGQTVIDAFNALGYQAAAIGNHEFDFGPEGPSATPASPDDNPRGALEARLRQARFPFLAANLIDTRTGRPVALPNTSPSTVVEVAGIRIGLVGLLTEPAMSFTAAPNVAGLATTPMLPALIAQATQLRAGGATMVIAVAHAGGRCTRVDTLTDDLSSCDQDAEIFQLARALPPGLVDAIVAGHRHDPLARDVNGLPIIQSGWGARTFGRIDFTVDRASKRPVGHSLHQPQPICTRIVPQRDGCADAGAVGSLAVEYEGATVAPATHVAAIVAPAVQAAQALRQESLHATAAITLPHDESGQSPVGDLAADWMLALAPTADAALTNTTGFRADISAGPFTYGALHALIPFDNQRVSIALTGRQLEQVVAANLTRSGSMVVLSGLRATAQCAGSTVRVSLHRMSGRAVAQDESLRVVTTDFLATGGDGFLTPAMPVRVLDHSAGVIRDEIAAWLKGHPGSWGADLLARPPRVVSAPARPMACR